MSPPSSSRGSPPPSKAAVPFSSATATSTTTTTATTYTVARTSSRKRKSKWASPTPSPRSTSAPASRRSPPASRSTSRSTAAAPPPPPPPPPRRSASTAVQSSKTHTAPPPPPPSRRAAPSRSAHPTIAGCRSVYNYQRLNHIEEGSYGVVFRAKDKQTGEIVALKKLKLEGEKNGFPITSLREIRTLMQAKHPNVVEVREIVVGDTLTQIYIVMEFVEHDLKTLLSTMRTPFLQSEIKTLMKQLLSAVALLHSQWIIHRDLKTSNLLMNNRGMLKVADFGLARTYGDPLGDMTSLVVTLWYRAPELLLGSPTYTSTIDLWSIGCIFAELLLHKPLFSGKTETEQLSLIFRLLGAPNSNLYPGITSLPSVRDSKVTLSSHTTRSSIRTNLRRHFRYVTENAIDLLASLLDYDPEKRISAAEALKHPYFEESPAPAHPDSFGSFPSVAAGDRRRSPTPTAPQRQAANDYRNTYQMEFDL
ncbi:hypothetical protein ACQY0O_007676 [Thecaphora frezii]